jgi:eukaryotic-like serine/threonine-protein kinase
MSGARGNETSLADRYVLCEEVAAGGMATVHLGRLLGPVGFARTVAIKRLHAQFARDPEFVSMFLDEARLAARIRHPNVVSTLDVVARAGELFLVMEYVHGESLSTLLRRATNAGQAVPLAVAVAIVSGILYGLHAAHEATDERGNPLRVIHRDVSPQNILVDRDGVPRLLDFGVARAAWRVHTTRDGQLKGKLGYMGPEQLRGEPVDRRVDVFSAAVVLWEMLAGRRMYEGDTPSVYAQRMAGEPVVPPRRFAPSIPSALDATVMRGLAAAPDRFATAREMAIALEGAAPLASAREIGEWVVTTAGADLARRAARVTEIESAPAGSSVALSPQLAKKVRQAEAREARSRMATELSLSQQAADFVSGALPTIEGGAPSVAGVTSTTTVEAAPARGIGVEATDARNAGPSVVPGRPRRPKARRFALAVVGTALAIVGGSTCIVRSRAPMPIAASGPSPPSTYNGNPNPETAPTSAPSIAPGAATPTASGTAFTAPSSSATAGSAAAMRSTAGIAASANPTRRSKASHPPSRASSTATMESAAPPKSNLCMKHREDGVVYFEPCQ